MEWSRVNHRVVFIGAVNLGRMADCGETAKNQILHNYLLSQGAKIYLVDTKNWKSDIRIWFKAAVYLLLFRNCQKILSASTYSSYRLIRILYFLGVLRTTHYFVIGNTLIQGINRGIYNSYYYRFCRNIYVEGKYMVDELKKRGVNVATYTPNFKKLDTDLAFQLKNKKLDNNRDKLHFVFLSRICPEKGCDLIFDAAQILNNSGLSENYEIGFYGPIKEDYREVFQTRVRELSNVNYNGFLNLTDKDGYHELSSYDVLLFPSFWYGEGFPGVLIDAFYAGLPVIVSNWNLNADIIDEGKNGFVLDEIDAKVLSVVMKDFILGAHDLDYMRDESFNSAFQYDVSEVLKEFKGIL